MSQAFARYGMTDIQRAKALKLAPQPEAEPADLVGNAVNPPGQ
jgi:chemotaxis protein MotB